MAVLLMDTADDGFVMSPIVVGASSRSVRCVLGRFLFSQCLVALIALNVVLLAIFYLHMSTISIAPLVELLGLSNFFGHQLFHFIILTFLLTPPVF